MAERVDKILGGLTDMWIKKIKPELVGGKSTLPDCLAAEGASLGWAAAETAALLPPAFLVRVFPRQAHCANLSNQVPKAGTKWLHWTIDSVFVCA
jgi:hypothetical protein